MIFSLRGASLTLKHWTSHSDYEQFISIYDMVHPSLSENHQSCITKTQCSDKSHHIESLIFL